MKTCWGNLDGIRLTKNGTFVKGTSIYVEMEACKVCGESYLTIKSKPSKFCSQSCSVGGKNHYMFGKVHTIETRKKLSIINTGKTHTADTRKKISKANSRRIGILSSRYKGGVKKLGLTTYDTHKDTLGIYEDIRKQKGTEVLEARCAYCGQWYVPKAIAIYDRLKGINNINVGERRLYCSENCKQACPIYHQIKYPKGFNHITAREVNPYLRQMVLERDNWECQICGKTTEEAQLHCHHMDPVAQNPMFQNDTDSCITLCKDCHKKVHKQHGCRYVDLRCK
jgi:hypothetical protein